MRVALSLVALALTVTACGLADDEVPAQTREADVVEAVETALPVAQEVVGAEVTSVAGEWSSCPGGVGQRFDGGGTLKAPRSDPEAMLRALSKALVDKGFVDETRVDGHVSVTRGDVEIDFQSLDAAFPGTWKMSFQGPCHTYSGDDADYVKDKHRKTWS